MSALALVGLALAMLATGLACLDLLGVRAPSAMLQTGLGLAAGLAITVALLYASLALGERLDFRPTLAVLGAGTIAWTVRAWQQRARWKARISPTALALALVGLVLAKLSVAAPFSSYDDRAIWGLKAKALLVERGIDGQVFQDLDVIHYHRDYPLGLPLLVALCGYVGEQGNAVPDGVEPAGSAAEWVQRHSAVHVYAAFAVLWSLGIAVLALGSLASALPWRLARVAALPLAIPPAVILPWIAGDSWSLAGADLPLCLCIGGAAVAIAHWRVHGGSAWFFLATLLAGTGIALKREAWIVVGLLAFSLLVAGPPRPRLREAASAVLLLVALIAAPLAVGARVPHPPFEEDYVANLLTWTWGVWLERIPLLPQYAWQALDKAYMAYFWLAILIAAVPTCWRGDPAERVLALWIVLHTLCVAAVFVVTPDQLAWHVNTALPRLMGHMAIPAGLLGVRAVARWIRALQGARQPLRAQSAT